MEQIIPIVLTFNDNYAIPAGVAMYSLVKAGNQNFIYEFNIIHNGLSVINQKKIIKNLEIFTNCKIKFIYCDKSFDKYFSKLKNKQHFSSEMFFKLLIPSLLPQYDKVVVTDVDVLFKGDISQAYIDFCSDNYIAAIKHYSKSLILHLNEVYFNNKYSKKINKFGAGFMVYNLRKMRLDNIEDKMLNFLKENVEYLIYPEQECINYAVSEKVEFIDLKYMVVKNWISSDLINEEIKDEFYYPYSREQVLQALSHPIQIHYAGSIKPWNNFMGDDFDEWFKELSNTIFLKDYLQYLHDKSIQNLSEIKYLLINYTKIKHKYWRYKILSKITFGKKRKKYKQKKKDMKARLKEVKKFLKG